ncbi:MAG: hypothetical protein R2852_09230 [Bacteroidia bacterium]
MQENAAIRNGDYQTICTVKGVDSNYFAFTGLSSMITNGEALLKYDGYNYVVLGSGIDQRINANIGGPFSLLSLITPRRGDFNTTDIDAIRTMEIEPSGVLTLDETISNRFVFVPIDFAQKLFERGTNISSFELTLEAGTDVAKIQKQIQARLGSNFKVQNKVRTTSHFI